MSLSNLYGAELAKVFDTMYQGFIAYEEEFRFYANKAKKLDVESILEIGCGTGNLARYFSEHFNSYLGLDLSEHMLHLAKEKNPNVPFMKADMRNFYAKELFDLALITGRSSSYLLSHADLSNTFDCISNVLQDQGYLIFDCIDASRFMPYVNQNPRVTHECKVGERAFKRESHWYIENREAHMVNWTADYYEIGESGTIRLGRDHVIFKTFTQKEIIQLLTESGYSIVNIEDRKSYAFDTFVVHAQKE